MRCLILILCLASVRIEASDWLNRTIRVDLIVDHINIRSFDPKLDFLVPSPSAGILNGVNATNGQFPWTIHTIAWSGSAGDSRIGIPCAATIISNNFVVSDLYCTGQANLLPSTSSIEAFIGFAQWTLFTTTPTHFVRSYWHIEASPENRPTIALYRLDESITFNPNARPIRLPLYQDFDYEGWSSLSLGFELFFTPYTYRLQSMKARVLNNHLCILMSNLADHEICVIDGDGELYDEPITRLDGFTGGPWIVYEHADAGSAFVPVLVGIQQFHFANQTASFGRGTRVSHFVEWIETLIAEN